MGELCEKLEAAREAFNRDGAVVLRDVFSQEWLQKVEVGIEKNKAEPSKYSESLVGEGGSGAYFNDYMNWSLIPEFTNYVLHSPAALIAKTLTGSDNIQIYHEHVLCKEPGTAKKTPWHHDQAYYPLDGEQVCSIWMPLEHVAVTETLMFAKGSHKQGYFLPYKFASELPYPVSNEELMKKVKFTPIPSNVGDHWDILQWDVSPGDCVVFHMKTLHAANPNMSTRHRRVISTRWVGDDGVYVERPWTCSPPVSGGLAPGDKFCSNTFPRVSD